MASNRLTAPPDLLLRNGCVHTMIGPRSPDSALAVTDGRVFAAGSRVELDQLVTDATWTIDLGGATVLPGFTDAHNHMLETGVNLNRIQLSGCTELEALLDVLSTASFRVPRGEWIVASSRWHESQLREGRLPTRAELDRAVRDHPVFLPRGGHLAVVNSHALERASVGFRAPDPPGGQFGRTVDGELDGLLLEDGAIRLITQHIPELSNVDMREALDAAANAYLAEGITAVRDPWLSRGQMEVYARAHADGGLRVRTTCLLYVDSQASLDDIDETVRWAHAEMPADDVLRFGGLKLALDGGIEAAALHKPYEGRSDYCGMLHWSDDDLASILLFAAERDLPVGLHVVGDAALEQFLVVCERVSVKHDVPRMRWCLEHVLLASRDQLARLARLGLLATYQLPLLHELAPAMVRNWGTERAQRACPVRSLMDFGVFAAGSSDSDVARFRPLDAIEWAITRETRLGRPLGRSEALDHWAAVHGYTAAGPYVTFDEDRRGTLEPGRLADLVIVDGDPLEPDCEVGALKVLAVFVAGQRVFDAGTLTDSRPGISSSL